eukprot:CAMPEP_0114283240 /NCGR_PEP_ID=MMETSP0059-20121206/3993_1 /TAXON_ID=36894 /ORGANISM="Pyramimonas parkeae, Strain CCMP726" /LENGTH=74 /DNA_ID=CAMNT_0001403949 /DNA_START=532 /DNA_END=756 /DNA_ORIENTATION=-
MSVANERNNAGETILRSLRENQLLHVVIALATCAIDGQRGESKKLTQKNHGIQTVFVNYWETQISAVDDHYELD